MRVKIYCSLAHELSLDKRGAQAKVLICRLHVMWRFILRPIHGIGQKSGQLIGRDGRAFCDGQRDAIAAAGERQDDIIG